MKFDKNHLVDIKSLTATEAGVFLEFLRRERQRHVVTANRCAVRVELWTSEYKRQREEVVRIDGGIERVNKKFGWEER